MCPNTPKLITVNADYNDIARLLPLTIIVSSKNWTILIIDKANITINRPNRLIAHPYTVTCITNCSSLLVCTKCLHHVTIVIVLTIKIRTYIIMSPYLTIAHL